MGAPPPQPCRCPLTFCTLVAPPSPHHLRPACQNPTCVCCCSLHAQVSFHVGARKFKNAWHKAAMQLRKVVHEFRAAYLHLEHVEELEVRQFGHLMPTAPGGAPGRGAHGVGQGRGRWGAGGARGDPGA